MTALNENQTASRLDAAGASSEPQKIISPKVNGPTTLTIARILFVIPLMLLIFQDDPTAKAFTLFFFVVASATDFVDGRWARSENLVTDLGAFLDPLADKMLVNLTLLALVSLGLVPLWMFAVILVRDFAVDGLRMMAARKGITISAAKAGKIKTTLQMITISSILLNRIINLVPLGMINIALLFIVVSVTLYSGVLYLIKGRKLLI